MTFIHTFNSEPMLKNIFGYMGEYLETVRANIIDYTYSAYCIKSMPGCRIVLYADPVGAEILNHIPYDEVHVLNDFHSDARFAASIKFEAIKHMTKNDVLIDGDLFIQNPECLKIIKSYDKYDFVYSFFEPNLFIMGAKGERADRYEKLVNQLAKKSHLFTHPYELPISINEIQWPNTSFMKFNNMDLKKKYLEQYMKFKNNLSDLVFENTWPDLIIEQFHMGRLLEAGGYKSKAMIEGFPSAEGNNYAISIGFTHLGGPKRLYTNFFADRLEQRFGKKVLEQANEQITKWGHEKLCDGK